MRATTYIAVPLMAGLMILQASFLWQFRVLGLTPQILVLVVIAWTLRQGWQEGLIWAFMAGIFLDLFSIAPMGTTALALMGTTAVIAVIQQNLPANQVIVPLFLAALATAVYLTLNLLLLTLLGHPVSWQITGVIARFALLHALLILPVYWLIYGLDRLFHPRRVQI
jgi:rod shape-determining protein MreD